MIPCKTCGTHCNDDWETCPSCGVSLLDKDAARNDDSYLSKDKWGSSNANDSDSRTSSPQETQELLPRDAPIKKAITRKSASGRAKFGATIMGVRPDIQKRKDETIPLGSKIQSEIKPGSGPQSTLVLGKQESAAKASPQSTLVLGATESAPKATPQSTLVLGATESAPEAAHQPTLVLGADALSPSPVNGDLEIDPVSPQLTKGDQVEILVQSQSEIDLLPEAGAKPAESAEYAAPNRIGALSRDDDDRFYRQSPRKPLAHDHTPPHRNHTRLGVDSAPSLSVSLGISSAILISTWLIPNVFSGKPVFPFSLVGSTHGSDLVALLTEPTCGALLLALILLPISLRMQATASLVIGLLSLSIPLLLGSPALPLGGPTVLVAALIDITVAVLIFVFLRVPSLGHFALLLVPGVLFATAVFGVTSGRLPAAHLIIFKTPLNIYASMLISGLAAAALLHMARRNKTRT